MERIYYLKSGAVITCYGYLTSEEIKNIEKTDEIIAVKFNGRTVESNEERL